MSKVSISVMACQEREHFFPYLREKLGDVPFAIDAPRKSKENVGIWENCKRAWDLHDPQKKYHLVIQDDALICDNFHERLNNFIEKIEQEQPNEEFAFQLFFGNRPLAMNADEFTHAQNHQYIIKHQLAWGVAIMLPTKYIEEMKKFGDNYSAQQDDTKIKHFAIWKKLKTIFPVPCFINHRTMKESPTLTKGGDSNRVSSVFIDDKPKTKRQVLTNEKIPRIIHQIWIGDKKQMPTELMNTWKMEGWEYKLWTENEIDKLGLENRKLYDYFYKKKCYYGASDIVRLEVLNRFGGIYIDADTERLEKIEPLLKTYDFFSVYSNMVGRVANGVIASTPNHPIIEAYIKAMGEAKTVEPVWSTIGGTLFTEMITKHWTPDTHVYKPRTFYPFDSKGVPAKGRDKIYARHYWKSTHKTYGN